MRLAAARVEFSIEMPADARTRFAEHVEVVCPSQLLLYVTCGETESVYLLQPGITIGRSPDNAVCVDHCDLTSVHARVHRVDGQLVVSTTDPHWWLTLPSGNDTRSIELSDGAEFSIGEAHFRCAAGRVAIVSPDTPVDPVKPHGNEPDLDDSLLDELLPLSQFLCPQCSEMLLLLPPGATFCPRCGQELPDEHPATALPALHEKPIERPATLVAYVNALFRLAKRFELGRDGETNPAQAMRYYQKAAKLGNRLARLRLALRGTTTGDDRSHL